MVDQGELDCYKSNGKDSKYIKTYVPGEVFGELALLYNAPRAATITAKTDAVLFALDRLTFNTIVKDAAEKRRRNNEEVLKRVEILKEVEPYERGQIADVLREIKVRTNEIIISEGEVGDKFYIVSEGAFVALKKDKNHNDQVVFNYKEGDYFGELALLKDIPRQASVQALVQFYPLRPTASCCTSSVTRLSASWVPCRTSCNATQRATRNSPRSDRSANFHINCI